MNNSSVASIGKSYSLILAEESEFFERAICVKMLAIPLLVAEGLWSKFSTVNVVKIPFSKTAGQTTPSFKYVLTTESPSCVYISNTRSYEMHIPC